MFAKIGDTAGTALGLASLTDIASMEDEPVVGRRNLLGGYMLHQLALGLEGSLAVVG